MNNHILVQPSLFLLVFVLAAGSSAARAEEVDEHDQANTQCIQVQDGMAAQLNRKFRRTDKKGLADRRKQLRELFENTSQSCATMLLYEPLYTKQGDLTLADIFYGKLAVPTQKELINILKERAGLVASSDNIVDGHGEPRGSRNRQAANDVHCRQVQDDVTGQLRRKFRSTDNKGLAARRKKLNELFESASDSCAMTLDDLLSEKQSGSALSTLFHRKLASATREELLEHLDRADEFSFFGRVYDGTSGQAAGSEH